MAVGLRIDFLYYQVGHGDFLHSFFSTISYHLESNGWGSRFPFLLNELYKGKIKWQDVKNLRKELKEINKELVNFNPSQVIWDIEDLSKKPPWGDNISSEISNLSNYFVTSNGKDLFEVLFKALDDAEKEKIDLEIVSL